MKQKQELVDKLVSIYRSLVKHPNIVSGEIVKTDSDNIIKINSKWSQRNLERKELSIFQKLIFLDTLNCDNYTFHPTDISTERLSRYSKSGKYYCTLRESPLIKESASASNKKQFLEIWESDFMHKNFDIEELNVHGPIYYDVEFGTLEWSHDESQILYIAEKKAEKSQSFYTQKQQDTNGMEEDTLSRGEEYLYKSDWGEQLVDKYQSVIGICDLKSETLKVIEGIPSNLFPSQVLWAKNDKEIYGIALKTDSRKLGLIYCTNRRGYVFHLTLKGKFMILSEENKSVRSLRLSLDGNHIYWLQRPAEGPHDGCQELVKYDLISNKADIIIPVVRKPSEFCGLYCHGLPRRCFSNDGKRLYFSTVNKAKITSHYVNLDTKQIHVVKTDDSAVILDVFSDMILIATSNLKSSPSIKLSMTLDNINWISLAKQREVIKDAVIKHMEFNLENADTSAYFNAIYFGPAPMDNRKIPLVVYLHGGPHSCVTDAFTLEGSFFASLGFGVLFVNYRGSTGHGQDGVDFLLGKISDSDVKDTHYAVKKVLEEIPYLDADKIVLTGGSHGGFLVTHLSAQYPEVFKAVVARNPVIDIFAMYCSTDIPDWDAVESGFVFNESLPLTLEQANTMLKISPIYQANKIKIPTLLMIGKKDLRVPYHQGLYLYNTLKARNVTARLNVYDDNHPLGQVPVHLDSTIHAGLWFLEHLGISDL